MNQKFSEIFEIIIVNNESTDNTVKKVEDFQSLKCIENLKIINSKGKLGKVRNRGIFSARGRWIAFIDADEIADSNWLKEFMKAAETHDIIMGPGYALNSNISSISKAFDLIYKRRNEIYKKKKVIKSVYTGNLLVNKNIFDNGNRFDDNFPTSEDGDLAYRLYKKGYKFAYWEKAIIYHKVPETLKQLFSYQKKMVIGKLLIFLKHHDLLSLSRAIIEVFYWLTPNFMKVYKKNNLISKLGFRYFGFTMTVISLYCYFNPFILFRLKRKISRPK